MNDTVVKKSELVIDALQYAHDHNLDINSMDDVQKILDVLDPEHKEDIDDFMEILKTSDTFMGMDAREKEFKKTDLPN
ncbi:hypothetical protein HYU91_00580 [Candidatus Collierbacteria bacterium]|nr:hypothetical protein [Candidatus Collierbacteria bacterium]